MAKTITLNLTKVSGSPETARQSVSDAGRVGRGISQLGKGITDLASDIGQVQRRRERERANSEYSVAIAKENRAAKAEEKELQRQFDSNPEEYEPALIKSRSDRHKEIVKSMKSPQAKERFSLYAREVSLYGATLEAPAWANNRRIELTEDNYRQASEEAGVGFFEDPPDTQTYRTTTAMQMAAWEDLDRPIEQINKEKSKVAFSLTKNAMDSHAQGTSLSSLRRINEIAQEAHNNKWLDGAKILKMAHDARSRVFANISAENKGEAIEMKNLVHDYRVTSRDTLPMIDETIAAADLSAKDQMSYELTESLREGFEDLRQNSLVQVDNPVLISSKLMTPQEREHSSSLKLDFYDKIADSKDGDPDDLRHIVDGVHQEMFTGKMSAEDAKDIIMSSDMRNNSVYLRSEFKRSDSILRESSRSTSFSPVFGSRNSVNRKLFSKLYHERDQLVRDGLHPVAAANQVILRNDLNNEKNLPDLELVFGDVSNFDGMLKARQTIDELPYDGAIKDGPLSPEDQKLLEELEKLEKYEKASPQTKSANELQNDLIRRKGK